MSNVALIPARGGSRRIPRKNIRPFHGQPIIAYSIYTALASGLFDGGVIVSTDDDEIAEVAQNYGADVLRRGQEWGDECIGPLDVARHSLSTLPNTALMCVVYATAPLMTVADLHRGYYAVKRDGAAYACSVGTYPFLHDAAQFFWCRAWALRESYPEFGDQTVLVTIPRERDCDIDTQDDWGRAEQMYAALHGERIETMNHPLAFESHEA